MAEAAGRALDAHRQGDACREEEKWEDAIAYYAEAIRLNAEFSWSHHSLGDCYKKLGAWENAIAAYRQAIALNEDFVWSHYSLGESLESLEEWAGAAICYRRVRRLAPDNETVVPRLAGVLKALLEKESRNIIYYQELAELLVLERKTAEAVSTYQMALQIHPEESTIALALSELLLGEKSDQAYLSLDRSRSSVVTYQDIHSVESLCDESLVTALLSYTHLFDADYYRMQHTALATLGYKALLQHYITEGSAAGYQPNPLFDDAFYRREHPEIAARGVNLLAHYHCFGYKAGDDPHPFFSTAAYQSLNPDVAAAEIDPLEHYLAYGAKEGRVAFVAEQFSHVLGGKTPVDADCLQLLRGSNAVSAAQSLGVYCNTQGNYFITEIADFVAAALVQAGHDVTRLSEQDVPPEGLDGHWVIAPHEFFYLGEGLRWTRQTAWLKQAVMVNVEQPQTTWFSKAFHFLRHTRCIFDINVKSAAIMQVLGLPAYWLPLGMLEGYAPFSAAEKLPDLRAMRSLPVAMREQLPALAAPLSERPLDIQFIGTLNPRRERFFAESASWLSQYRCFLHMPPMGVPLLKGQDQALDTEAVIGISRRSKILLNVHRDPLPYFEWHRIVFHGLWQNTLVVTEPCHDIPGLVAGEHFVACALPEMAEIVEWLLRSADGKKVAERIRQAGHSALATRFAGAQLVNNALALSKAALGAKRGEKRGDDR